MNKWLVAFALCWCSAAVAANSSGAADLVNRAFAAAGGQALAEAKTLVIRGRSQFWDVGQSFQAQGEPRAAGESGFVQSRDLVSGSARTDWQRKLPYPFPREYKFSEIVAAGIGYVEGVDSTSRVKQSLSSTPPRHAMSGLRVATAVRELSRGSPTLLAEMARNPERVARLADQPLEGSHKPAVRYRGEHAAFDVLFDAASGLPQAIRSYDYDSVLGDSVFDLVLSDWREAGAIKYPYRQVYQLNGRTLVDSRIEEVRVNAPLPRDAFDIPAELRAGAPKMATGWVPYQWMLRRQHIGVLLDSDTIAYDPQSSPGLRLADLAPGIAHFVGGTHNSLFVEMQDYLVVVDAPMGEFYSKLALAAAAKRFPGKPVKYLVLTHHHMDHTSGVRTYAALGATLIVGKGNGAYFNKALAAPRRLGPDGPQKPIRAEIVEVDPRWTISDGKREVAVYLSSTASPNTHAAGMLIGYIPDARLGFVTDLWSPMRPPVGERPTPGQIEVVATVKRWGLEPERFAGGHGAVDSFAPLLKISAR